MMIIEAPHDPRTYATLEDTEAGVVVNFWQKTTVPMIRDRKITEARKFISSSTFDLPFHLVCDKVHTLLENFAA